MKHALYALGALMGAYLWADKFLFRGELAHLFRRGWAERLKPLTRHFAGRDAVPSPELSSEVPDAGELVPRKAYFPTPSAPQDASDPQAVSNASGDATFVAPPEPEMLEWRAPEFGFREKDRGPDNPAATATATPAPEPSKQPLMWGDAGFSSRRFIPRDDETGEGDWIEVYDPEQIRREVAAALEGIGSQTPAVELAPSDEEEYQVEHFDAGAYR